MAPYLVLLPSLPLWRQDEMAAISQTTFSHDDVIKWKHFPRNWPFVREIHRSPVNFPHKGQWRGALMFSLIYAWINDWVNDREAGDLRRQHGHYDVIVMNFWVKISGLIQISPPIMECLSSLHIPIDVIHKSHKTPVPYPTMHYSEQICAHFCSEWCTVAFGTGALWDLWD